MGIWVQYNQGVCHGDTRRPRERHKKKPAGWPNPGINEQGSRGKGMGGRISDISGRGEKVQWTWS